MKGAELLVRCLEHEGVRSFCGSYEELLDCIGSKIRAAPPLRAG